MSDSYTLANEFLSEVIKESGFELAVSQKEVTEGCILDMTGNDVSFLLANGGELLDALETLLNQIFGKQIPREQRIICDAEGFRQSRRTELQAMARFAAQSVRKTNNPFVFGKLTANERRIIHLFLQDEPDLKTESVGDGRDRRLQISMK